MTVLKGLATGIGSLPHKDADSALDLVFKYTPGIPFWPQLPKRDVRESMTAQFSENFPCIKVTDKGAFFNAENKEKELEKFYDKIKDKDKITNEDIEYFKISQDFAQGLYAFRQRLERLNNSDLNNIEYIKLHVTGPFTFAASIKDEKGIALQHDYDLMQIISQGIAMKAAWQIKFFEKFGKKMIVFIDEPYLGCFGSAYTPVNREDVENVLAESGETFKDVVERLLPKSIKNLIPKGNVLLGIHCCGNTDWSIFTDIEAIDIISFDAFSFLDKLILYADNLKEFFKRGGILCWGIVPTQDFSGQETAYLLMRKIRDAIDTLAKKGLDKDLLSDNLLISPSCGLGTLDQEKSDKIFSLLAELSSSLRKTL